MHNQCPCVHAPAKNTCVICCPLVVLHPADRTRDAISAGVALSVADLDAETSHELVSGAVILVRSIRLNLLDTLVCKSDIKPGVWLGVYMSSVATLNAKGGRI